MHVPLYKDYNIEYQHIRPRFFYFKGFRTYIELIYSIFAPQLLDN